MHHGFNSISQRDATSAAADSAATYLASQALKNGLFVYERDAADPEWTTSSYNLLRHCGSLYALSQYHGRQQDQQIPLHIRLAGLKILDWLRPLPHLAGTLAAWSLPGINDTVGQDQVKLGGTALALLALTELNACIGNFVDGELLQQLASGITAMQRGDGFFISKFIPAEGGFKQNWTSLFYPGEAALALLRLARHQSTDAERWRSSAELALQHLAKLRQNATVETVPLDHWALIATGEWFSQGHRGSGSSANLQRHAKQIIEAMVSRQIQDYANPRLHGSFAANGSTTTTATCLEGLLAIRPWLQHDLPLAEAVDQACEHGHNYLLRAQLQHGVWRGAIPSLADPNPSSIRIDYVQHALSAFVGMAQQQRRPAGAEGARIAMASSISPADGLLTGQMCREALDLGLAFLLAQVDAHGRVTYEVPLQPGPPEQSRHQVREAGGIWGLSLYLHRAQLSADQRHAIWDALGRAMAHFETTSVCAWGRRRPMPEEESAGALGTAALNGLALVEMLAQSDCPAREQRQRWLQELLAFILSCRQSSGRFHSGYDLTSGDPRDAPSPYFDGETVLLLAKAARVLGLTAFAVPASTGADAMFDAYAAPALAAQQLSDDCKGFYQWGSMAMRELHLLNPSERCWGDRVLAMADWILDVHQVLQRRRNTGYAFEGLVSAFALARDRDDQPRMRRLRTAIESGLSRLCTWQLGASLQTQALQTLHRRNPQAFGGVMGGRKDPSFRIDTVQHQMHALQLAERELGL